MPSLSAQADKAAKESGAYYTPRAVAAALVKWAVRRENDLLLDPSCGDGRFVALHPNSVGIERNAEAAGAARQRAPQAAVHPGDFFAWAEHTGERFHCAAGNPPFIRYQTFNGGVRARALALCARIGVSFSGLTSSWAPFLVVTASLLRRGGRMAFVVPASIGHAPHAAPLMEYLLSNFDAVRIVPIRRKLFPKLSEDCWLLFAEGFGGEASSIHFAPIEQFSDLDTPPRTAQSLPVDEWRGVWNRRLRPYLLTEAERAMYQEVSQQPDSLRLGAAASVGIGYVSGANEFFHLRPSEADRWQIPQGFLHPTVRNGRMLPRGDLSDRTVRDWRRADKPMLLLRIPKNAELPRPVLDYLDSPQGWKARQSYKCRNRKPWYSVPDVRVPAFFLTYMSGSAPHLVRNSASAACTNALHAVHLRNGGTGSRLVSAWGSMFVQLSCELEGHALGGGMLKLEPSEAAQVVLPSAKALSGVAEPSLAHAVRTLRRWRHYEVAE